VKAGLLFDATRCIGCNACSAACKEQNGLPLPIESEPTAYTWTTVQSREGENIRRLCMHCLDPTCVSVCPVGALRLTATGAVDYDGSLCIGCRYCIMACPFGVPKYQWDSPVPVVGKCTLCVGRLERGLPTACASVCPTGATLFGDREALAREARQRLASSPGRYASEVYGLEEAGGTSVLMLTRQPAAELGLPTPPRESLPVLTWRVLSRIPDFVAVAAATLWGVHWITRRRDDVAEAESAAPASGRADASAPSPGVWARVAGLWRR
jgi:formate dehydrogenase iron-sulfur subunit